MPSPRDAAKTTASGIPGIGPVQANLHMSHFYMKREDLVDAMIPFLKAGLENGERCLWITTDPLRADDAAAELAKAVPGLDAMLREERILIIDAEGWYSQLQGDFAKAMLSRMLKEVDRAQADGYRALRLAGNTNYFANKSWAAFMQFEEALHVASESRPIISLCSYSLPHIKPTDVFQAVRVHHHTLDRRDRSWELI